MKYFKKILVGGVMLALMVGSALPGYAQQDDSLGQLANDAAVEVVDEVVFENLSRLAGPACSLYAVGIDLVNVFYDGQWAFYDPLLEMSVLFRNQSWRELIWALNDQRDAFVEQLTAMRKRQCVLNFSLPQARFEGEEAVQQRQRQVQSLDRQIVELEAKIDYFGVQRKNVLFDRPKFADTVQFDGQSYTFPPLPTDKIFYSLFAAGAMNWEQFARDSKQFVLTTYQDLAVVLQNIPETCFASVNVAHELWLYFAYAFSLDDGVYRDEQGNTYENFRDFVQNNAAAISEQYIDTFCEEASPRQLPELSATSAEVQYERLLQSLGNLQDTVATRITEVRGQITLLEQKRRLQGSLNPNEVQQLLSLETLHGTYQGMVEYYALVLAHVGTPSAQSLTRLSEKLSQFVEAVLGVVRDDDGQAQSRLSFAERFEKSKERQLQQICTRIENMYRQSGRNTADLPVIGSANGRVYCRARPECEDVNLSNFFGGSEGRKKLAECSGFLFDSSELGYDQVTQEIAEETGEDIGFILQQRAYQDLIQSRNLHFSMLRDQYQAVYGTETASTAQLDNILKDVSVGLYLGPEPYDPVSGKKSQYSVMKKIYADFWKFMDQQEGSCPAPEDPEE